MGESHPLHPDLPVFTGSQALPGAEECQDVAIDFSLLVGMVLADWDEHAITNRLQAAGTPEPQYISKTLYLQASLSALGGAAMADHYHVQLDETRFIDSGDTVPGRPTTVAVARFSAAYRRGHQVTYEQGGSRRNPGDLVVRRQDLPPDAYYEQLQESFQIWAEERDLMEAMAAGTVDALLTDAAIQAQALRKQHARERRYAAMAAGTNYQPITCIEMNWLTQVLLQAESYGPVRDGDVWGG